MTLTEIVDSILSREQKKLSRLSFEDHTLKEKLYTPEEQIARIIKRLYGNALVPPLPVNMSIKDQKTYMDALETWLPEHPFLDGTGKHPSSVIFGGFLVSKALNMESISETVLRKELNQNKPANPFLYEFYISNLERSGSSNNDIRADHIGILYASLRACLAQGEIASLRIEGEIDEEDDYNESADVEIIRIGQNSKNFPSRHFIETSA